MFLALNLNLVLVPSLEDLDECTWQVSSLLGFMQLFFSMTFGETHTTKLLVRVAYTIICKVAMLNLLIWFEVFFAYILHYKFAQVFPTSYRWR